MSKSLTQHGTSSSVGVPNHADKYILQSLRLKTFPTQSHAPYNPSETVKRYALGAWVHTGEMSGASKARRTGRYGPAYISSRYF